MFGKKKLNGSNNNKSTEVKIDKTAEKQSLAEILEAEGQLIEEGQEEVLEQIKKDMQMSAPEPVKKPKKPLRNPSPKKKKI